MMYVTLLMVRKIECIISCKRGIIDSNCRPRLGSWMETAGFTGLSSCIGRPSYGGVD